MVTVNLSMHTLGLQRRYSRLYFELTHLPKEERDGKKGEGVKARSKNKARHRFFSSTWAFSECISAQASTEYRQKHTRKGLLIEKNLV